MSQLIAILQAPQDIFTLMDIKKLTNFQVAQSVRNFISKLCQQGYLQHIARGMYAKASVDISKYLLTIANKAKQPSYVSLETMLYRYGAIFQYNEDISMVSNNSLRKKICAKNIVYHKIQNSILYNTLGIEYKNGVALATVERAFGDMVYLQKKLISLDAKEMINTSKLKEYMDIYDEKTKSLLSDFITQ